MAVVGSASIIVRAITKDVRRDINRAFSGTDRVGSSIGGRIGSKFVAAFSKSTGGIGKRLSSAFNAIAADAEQLRQSWVQLQKTGFVLQTGVGVLAGSLGSLVGGLGSLIGSAGAASVSLVALAGTFIALKIGVSLAKLALSGVGEALNKLKSQQGKGTKDLTNQQRAVDDAFKALAQTIERNAERLSSANKRVEKAQRALNDALEEGKEELQQLGFEAEDAALAEKRAAMELEDARAALARVQDLPPNSRARKEAELAFAEAELNLRKAKDRTADLAKEQDKLAGDVENTEGVIRAREALAEAEDEVTKAVRDGSREQEEAKERLRRAQEDLNKAQNDDGGAGSDPFAGLTESQVDFVKYLATIQPELDKLKEAVAKGFLPELEKQIDRAIKVVFPTLTTGFETVGVSLGVAVRNFMDEVTKSANLTSLASVFETTAYVVESFGTIGGKAFGILVTVLEAADPLIRRFVDFIENKLTIFDDFLKTENAEGRLTEFFNRAGDIAADFGEIFGNVFDGIGDLIADSFEPGSGGDMLLQWLKDATAGFAAIGDDKGGLREFLQGTAGNSIAIFQSIGALIKEIIDLGAMPEIKVFWDTLKEGAPFVGEILRNGILAGPQFADLLVAVTKIVAAFTDAGTIQTYFGILAAVAGKVAEFFQSDAVKKFLDFLGPIVGAMLAIGTIVGTVSTVFWTLVGTVLFLWGKIKMLWDIIKLVGLAIRIAFMASPLGVIITVIGLVVAALVYFFTQTEVGKEMWANFTKFLGEAWDNMVKFLGEAWENIKAFFEPVLKFIGDLIQTYIDIWVGIFTFFVDGFKAVWEGITDFFTPVVEFISTAFTTAFDIMRAVFEIFSAFFLIGFVVIGTAVQATWDAIVAGFEAVKEFLRPIIDAIFGFFNTVFTNIGNFIKDVWDGIVAAFGKVRDFLRPIVDAIFGFFRDIFKKVGDFVKGVWDGIQRGFQAFYDWVKPVLDKVGGFFSDVFKGVSDFFKRTMNNMIGFAEGFVNFFIDGINGIITAINKIKLDIPPILQPVFGGQKTLGFNIAKVQRLSLPRLAEGGVVYPQPGGVLAQIAEAGRAERVEPLDSTGLSQRDRAMIEQLAGDRGNGQIIVHMTVNPSEGMDERELAAVISRQLAFQFRKGAIR